MTRSWKIVLAVICLMMWSAVAGAQQPMTALVVRGLTYAADTRAPVAGVTVVTGSSSAVSGADGTFTLVLPPAGGRLVVTGRGYLERTIDVLPDTLMPLEIALAPSQQVREEVNVSADAIGASSAPATLAVTPGAVLRVAGAGENIFKALQTLPGISATDDFGSRLAVRGGGPDQNLTVMDGVEIHNPYRLFGLTSAFNPETVGRFELTAGGFGAEYGDRLSSILVVENRPGSERERLAGSAALSFTDTNVVLEGRLPGRARGSWLATGRRTYYDLVADRITGNDLPSFADLQVKTVWDVRPGHSLTAFALRSRERTEATFKDSGDSIAVGNDSKNDLVSLSYRVGLSPTASSRTIVAWYDYRDALGVDGSVRDGARRSNSALDDGKRADIVFTRDLGVRDVSIRQQVDWQQGRHLVAAGADAHVLRTRWGWTITGDRNSSAANGSAVIGGAGLPSLLVSTRRTTRSAAWIRDRLTFGNRVHVEPGVRIDWSGINDELIVSPRSSMDVQLSASARLKAALGRFTQSPGYEKLLQSDYFVDLSADTAASLSSERATHAIVGLEHAVSRRVLARIEAYSKRFSQVLLGRLETPAEQAARVATYRFPAALASSVPSAPIITSVPTNGGSGHAYGFDLFLEQRQTSPTDRLSGWMSYTWGRANLDAYGVRRPFDYDRRHAFSIVSTVGLWSRLDVGATVRVASGFPTTTPVGLRVAAEPAADLSGALVPALANGLPVWTVDFGDVSNLSRERLPVYARLDLRATFKPKNPNGRWQFYIDILNATNRKNVGRLEPDLQFDPSSDRPQIAYSTDSGLPLLPSIGFRYRF